MYNVRKVLQTKSITILFNKIDMLFGVKVKLIIFNSLNSQENIDIQPMGHNAFVAFHFLVNLKFVYGDPSEGKELAAPAAIRKIDSHFRREHQKERERGRKRERE